MEIFTIIALLLGPLIGIRVQNKLDDLREAKERKLAIFKTLMATRANRISFPHVQALNSIDLEFTGKSQIEKDITTSWKIYLDHLHDFPKKDAANFDTKLDAWLTNGDSLFTDLIHKMSRCFGYDFDIVHLRKGIYSPIGHSELELDQSTVRKGLVDLFKNKEPLSIKIIE